MKSTFPARLKMFRRRISILRTSRGRSKRFYYDTNTYDDEARDMEKFAIVYLPYGYDPDDEETRYNVLYLMHGASGSESSYFGTPE